MTHARQRIVDIPVGGLYLDGLQSYVDAGGRILQRVHEEHSSCATDGCAVHSPSDHHMRHMPTYWRNDRGMMERICEHGVGHPDPDHMAFMQSIAGPREGQIAQSYVDAESVHGCCGHGCCTPPLTPADKPV